MIRAALSLSGCGTLPALPALPVIFGMLGLAGSTNTQAQMTTAAHWPSKPITLVVSFPPGGDSDTLARILADKLAPRLGQPVVIEHRSGASGTIGNAHVARAAPDGHTLLCAPNTLVTAPWVIRPGTGAPYNAIDDFAPVSHVGNQSLYLVVNSDTGLRSVAELLAAAKAGQVKAYASPGSGSPMHILGALFNRSAGTQIAQVPYRGVAPALADVLGGHVPMMFTTLGPVAQHIASGRLRNLAVADLQRSPLTPEVPTLAEAGVAQAEMGAWHALLAPKGTAASTLRALNQHVDAILAQGDVQARLRQMGLMPVGGRPEALERLMLRDDRIYGRLVKELGIEAD